MRGWELPAGSDRTLQHQPIGRLTYGWRRSGLADGCWVKRTYSQVPPKLMVVSMTGADGAISLKSSQYVVSKGRERGSVRCEDG
jgi:hypothetical protein